MWILVQRGQSLYDYHCFNSYCIIIIISMNLAFACSLDFLHQRLIQNTLAHNLKVRWDESIIMNSSLWLYNDLDIKKKLNPSQIRIGGWLQYATISITTIQGLTVGRIFLRGGGGWSHMLYYLSEYYVYCILLDLIAAL